jgi:hypothetical protein
MEAPATRIDALLREAIGKKRLIRFTYKDKPANRRAARLRHSQRLSEAVRLSGRGLSSHPLPNWRWALVNSISDVDLLKRTFPGRRPVPSGKHHRWDQIFARVEPPETESDD